MTKNSPRVIPIEATEFATCQGTLHVVWPDFLTDFGSCTFYRIEDGTPAEPFYSERVKDSFWFKTELDENCTGCTVFAVASYIKDGKQAVRTAAKAPDDWHRI